MVLLLMAASQGGFSIGSVAWTTAYFAVILGVFLWYKTTPLIPVKSLLPFMGILSLSCICMGWPALKLHFNWISFVTDDYVNYCLAADRFKHFAFYRFPKVDELTGLDYTQYFWFMHVPAQVRFGAEHQIAWLSVLTGLRTLQVFMPVILAFGLVQITAICALVLHKGRFRKHAQFTGLFLAISPMFVFSSVYQLIAQVGGLGLMITLVTFLTANLRGRSRIKLVLAAVPVSLVSAALAMFYPEVSPFAAITVVIYFFCDWYKTKAFPAARVVLLQYVLILFIIILRYNVISYIYSLSNQVVGGLRQTDLALSLFPFFLIPSGIAALFGLQPMNADVPEPWGSCVIILGGLLFFFIIILCFKNVTKAVPYIILLAVEAAVALSLFRSGNDFGTYKIAMYLQPVLMAALAALFLGIPWRRLSWVLLAALAACMLFIDFGFMQSSMGKSGTIVAEVENVSAALVAPPVGPKKTDYWMSSIDNMIAAKLAAQVYRGGYLKFPSRDLFPVSAYLIQADWPLMQWYPHRDVYAKAKDLMAMRNQDLYTPGSVFGSDFSEPKASRNPTHYLSLTSDRNLFNKMHPDGKTNEDFFVVSPVADLRNFIIFVHSSLGSHYYLGDRRNISFYQQEDDYYSSDLKMNAMGRFFLLRVEHPSKQVYLRLAATKTLMAADRKMWSSSALVKGVNDVSIAFSGYGAANLFVGPVTPVKVGDAYYIAIDMGEVPRAFPSYRGGFKALYNQNIPLDYRWLISYGRDISALSPEEYEALVRPTELKNFPSDIVKAKGLEFSGIYEDGWLSPDSHYVLGESHPGDVIRMRLQVPEVIFSKTSVGEARISVNHKKPVIIPLTANDFDWLLPIQTPSKKTDLCVSFSLQGILKHPDDRVVSAKLESIKILSISKVDFTTTGPRPPTNGIDLDGWCESKAVFDMPISEQSNGVVLRINYPGWWNAPLTSTVSISVDSELPHIYTLQQGINTITVPALPGVCARRVYLQSNQLLSLPKPDARQRVFCLMTAESNDLRYWKSAFKDLPFVLGAKVNYSNEGAIRPPTQGVKSDGWAEKEITFALPVSRDSNLISLELFYPGWAHIPQVNHLSISVDGEKSIMYDIQSGPNLIQLHEPIGFSSHTITVKADKTFIMPSPDNRECAYRLISVQSN